MTRFVKDLPMLFGTIVLASCLGVFSVPALKALESRYAPVVKDITMTKVLEDPEGVSLYMTGNKVRKCTLLAITVLVHTGEQWEKGRISFDAGPVSPTETRPTGIQSFGILRITPKGDVIKVSTTHRCHDLWDTTNEDVYYLIKDV